METVNEGAASRAPDSASTPAVALTPDFLDHTIRHMESVTINMSSLGLLMALVVVLTHLVGSPFANTESLADDMLNAEVAIEAAGVSPQ
jgi:hypothetical protein